MLVEKGMRKHFSLLISLLLVILVGVSPAQSSTTILNVNPSSIIDTSKVAQATFTIKIDIKDVTDLYTFDFSLNYSADVLSITASAVGSFFGEEPQSSFIWKNVTDSASGYLRFMVSLPMGTPKGAGRSGSGTLMTLNFTVVSQGYTYLDVSNTKLWDSYAHTITHTAYDSYFSNIPLPQLYVYPDAEGIIDPSLVLGKNFTIEVNILNATDLYGCKLKLGYDTALLDGVALSEGDFLKNSGSTDFSSNINETGGVVWINVTLVGPVAGAVGNGTVAEITFMVMAIGESMLRLYDTELADSEGTLIVHAAVNGFFSNKPRIHDVSITKVETIVTTITEAENVTLPVAKRVSQVYSGDHVNVTVTVKNNGTLPETFNVTAYYENTTIGSKNGTVLSEGASTILTFEWNTEGVAVGEYTIWAEVGAIIEETNVANNKFTMPDKFKVLAPEHSFPTELVIAATVVIVAAVLAVYFLKFRKPKPTVTELQKT